MRHYLKNKNLKINYIPYTFRDYNSIINVQLKNTEIWSSLMAQQVKDLALLLLRLWLSSGMGSITGPEISTYQMQITKTI